MTKGLVLKWAYKELELIEALLDLRQHISHLHHPNLTDFVDLAPLLSLFGVNRGHSESNMGKKLESRDH